MRLVFKARYRIIRLGLQKRGLNPAFARRHQPRHTATVDKVGHQRGDENRFARPRKARHTKPDHRLEECLRDRILHSFNLSPDAISNLR